MNAPEFLFITSPWKFPSESSYLPFATAQKDKKDDEPIKKFDVIQQSIFFYHLRRLEKRKRGVEKSLEENNGRVA